MLLRIIDLELLKVGIRIQKLLVIRDTVVIDPSIGANKAVWKPAHLSLPVADKKVEIVRSIMRRSWRFTSCRGQQGHQERREQSNQTVFHKQALF